MDDNAKSHALNQINYGMYIIGSRNGEELNGMTANWVSQVSFDPPLVAIAIENDSHTRKLIDGGKVFSVNIVEDSEVGRALIDLMVKPQKPYRNKMDKFEFITGETGAPLFTDAVSWWECEVVNTIESGDHQLYIGKVVNAGINNADATPLSLAALGWHYGG
jgi:flavin reductase (DIM6/NTAB) family NADH-FMN oxidoreductase RutF